MPGIYDLKPNEKVFALLVGAKMYSLVLENNRVWWNLDFYTSEKSRATAAKKQKRHHPDAIYIAWEFTLEDIIKQGELLLVLASEKVLASDKAEILRQLAQQKE